MKTNLEYYKTFYYVGKSGSFTKAAQMLGSNQPNVSRTIKKLENDLKIKLLIRSHQGITLTRQGQQLYSHIEKAMKEILAGEKEMLKSQEAGGKVTIAVTNIAMTLFVFDVLTAFHKDYPDITIQILSTTTPEAIKIVENNQADLAIVTSPCPPTSLNADVLMTFDDILITGAKGKNWLSNEHQLEEFADQPFIGMNASSMTYHYLSDIFARHHMVYHTAIEVSAINQVIPFVKQDFGFAFVPLPMVEEPLKKGELMQVPLKPAMPERSIRLLGSSLDNISADYLRHALLMARLT